VNPCPYSDAEGTPHFFRMISSAQKWVKADWNRFNPAKAVKQNQPGWIQSLSQSGSMVTSPASDSAILSRTARMSRCMGVPS